MKKMFISGLLLSSLFSCQSDPENVAGKDKLKALLVSYYDALAKKDTAGMRSLTAAGFVLYEEGMIYNNESAAKFVEQLPAFTATFKFDSLNTHIDERNASAYYLREAVFTIQDSTHAPVKFLESATFKKENGEWKIRFIHSSLRK
ncbi:MAG: nuclear transport factor 2 family protein [Chitinophagaceae bacterium]|nr:nuclear transport factor 2 family protein [Chitinophagaceae bacterium]